MVDDTLSHALKVEQTMHLHVVNAALANGWKLHDTLKRDSYDPGWKTHWERLIYVMVRVNETAPASLQEVYEALPPMERSAEF